MWTLFLPLLLALTLSAADGPSSPVIVELFTSEGCSSCPPADHLLSVLDADQPIPGAQILVLSEHVDYWNRLGWTDPYSAAAFSDRQQRYASALRGDVYTPQMIVDGRVQFVGNDVKRARQAIEVAARLPKTPIDLQRVGDALQVKIDTVPIKAADAEVVLAIAESDLQSSVDRGENAGRRLRHTAVVRRLTVLGPLKTAPFSTSASLRLNPAWKREHLRAVVFIQERKTLRILGAAALGL